MRVSRYDWKGEDPAGLAGELRALAPPLADLAAEVSGLIEQVRSDGDSAVLRLEERFGGSRPGQLRVPEEAIQNALEGAAEVRPALEMAAANVRAVAAAEVAADGEAEAELPAGQRVRLRSAPVGAAGAYVPGGAAAYPSTALMTCVPAREAGVERVAVASPPGPDGLPNSLVLAACGLGDVSEVYAMGGVQAIAALALGTESVAAVDVVVGPGNRYVQEAKRQLFGTVGVDGIAGPSELMAVIDGSADPRWIALDLASQAEHGGDGLLVAVAVAPHHLQALEVEIELLAHRPDSTIGDAPLALVIAPDHQACVELVNAVAPEHLQLACEGSEVLVEEVRTAGCVFTGPYGATAFGDFVAGSNHVLPTGGAGRFAGPLGPRSFRRRIASVRIPQAAARELAPSAATLARAEGFPLHAESAEARGRSADARGLRKEPPVE
jgi:histidinol dehydrogenase